MKRLLPIFLFLFAMQVHADFSITAELSTNTIHIGDLATLKITTTNPGKGRLEFPDLNRDKKIIVRDQKQIDPLHYEFMLTSFEVGSYTVSTGTVRLLQSDGTALEKSFPELTLHVESMIQGTNTQFRDIKDVAQWPAAFPIRLLKALIVLIFIGLLAWWLIRRFAKKAAEAKPEAPPLPPHEIALQALRALLEKQWIEQENIEPFYVELSTIVRNYIEARFGLRAPESTTEEFIRDAASSNRLSLEQQQSVYGFLEQSDLVKFAKHRPQQSDMKAAYQAAELLIRETTQPSTINHSS